MTKVILTLTKDQAHAVNDALEIYSRLLMGQFRSVSSLFPTRDFDRARADDILMTARQVIMPELDLRGYYSIWDRRIREEARMAFDIQQVLRHALAWNYNPKGGIGVCYDEPFWTSAGPHPEVEIRCQDMASKKERKR